MTETILSPSARAGEGFRGMGIKLMIPKTGRGDCNESSPRVWEQTDYF